MYVNDKIGRVVQPSASNRHDYWRLQKGFEGNVRYPIDEKYGMNWKNKRLVGFMYS